MLVCFDAIYCFMKFYGVNSMPATTTRTKIKGENYQLLIPPSRFYTQPTHRHGPLILARLRLFSLFYFYMTSNRLDYCFGRCRFGCRFGTACVVTLIWQFSSSSVMIRTVSTTTTEIMFDSIKFFRVSIHFVWGGLSPCKFPNRKSEEENVCIM